MQLRKTQKSVTLSTIDAEMAAYKNDKSYNEGELKKGKLDLFKYWFNHRDVYPRLSEVASITLAVPASSLASKQFFSQLGDINSRKRGRMLASTIQMLSFAYFNTEPEDVCSVGPAACKREAAARIANARRRGLI